MQKRTNTLKHGKLVVLQADLERVMDQRLTQIEAARELKISVSTLKRRLSELKLKWPNTKKGGKRTSRKNDGRVQRGKKKREQGDGYGNGMDGFLHEDGGLRDKLGSDAFDGYGMQQEDGIDSSTIGKKVITRSMKRKRNDNEYKNPQRQQVYDQGMYEFYKAPASGIPISYHSFDPVYNNNMTSGIGYKPIAQMKSGGSDLNSRLATMITQNDFYMNEPLNTIGTVGYFPQQHFGILYGPQQSNSHNVILMNPADPKDLDLENGGRP